MFDLFKKTMSSIHMQGRHGPPGSGPLLIHGAPHPSGSGHGWTGQSMPQAYHQQAMHADVPQPGSLHDASRMAPHAPGLAAASMMPRLPGHMQMLPAAPYMVLPCFPMVNHSRVQTLQWYGCCKDTFVPDDWNMQ